MGLFFCRGDACGTDFVDDARLVQDFVKGAHAWIEAKIVNFYGGHACGTRFWEGAHLWDEFSEGGTPVGHILRGGTPVGGFLRKGARFWVSPIRFLFFVFVCVTVELER